MHPYGSSAYRSVGSSVEVSARRYRYTGKERDEETGLDYFGARYYAPWLGRWTTADPLGLQAGLNLYLYGRASPVVMVDPNGMQDVPAGPKEITRWSTRNDTSAKESVAAAGAAAGRSFKAIGPTDAEKAAAASSYRIWGHAPASGANVEPLEVPPIPTIFEGVPVARELEGFRNSVLRSVLDPLLHLEEAQGHAERAQILHQRGADDAALDEALQAGQLGSQAAAEGALLLAVPEEGAAAAAARQGATELAATRARWPSYTIGETKGGAAGTTDKFGNITIDPDLPAADLLETLRHEEVHSRLSPAQGGLFAEARANLGIWAYRNLDLVRYIEEALAEGYATRSVRTGLKHPFEPGYAISPAKLGVEGLIYTGLVLGPSAFVLSRE